MDMATNSLWQDLSAMADAFADLGRRFLSASRRLHGPGALPPLSLLEETGEFHRRFESLRSKIRELAEALGVPVPSDEQLSNLKALAHLLERVNEAETRRTEEAERARRAIAVLDRVLTLSYRPGTPFEPLRVCLDDARALRDAIAAGTTEDLRERINGLAEMDHPFAYLLTMVEGNEAISDELWEGLFDAVGVAFGRSLAAAVARSKIVIGGPTTSDAAPEIPREAEAPVTSPVVEKGAGVALPIAPPALVEVEPVSAPTHALGVDTPAAAEAAASSHRIDPAHAPTTPVPSAWDEVLASVISESSPILPRRLTGYRPERKLGRASRRIGPRFERLETMRLLSCNVISGYVFLDANNNGLYEPSAGETPIAGNTIELYNAANVLVGTTQTDSQGLYTFSTDSTINTAPQTSTQVAQIPEQMTNFTSTPEVAQFDPGLGDLTQVDIIFNGTLSTRIRAENTSTLAPATLTGLTTGQFTLSGPGVNYTSPMLSISTSSFNASTYDGVSDYAGTSGVDFGQLNSSTSNQVTLTSSDAALASFIGTGKTSFDFASTGNSVVNGGGNTDYDAQTTAQGSITVVYHYTPTNCLAPGNYTIVQPTEPPGTLNGRQSSDGTVLPPNPGPGPDTIPVTLGNTDSINNDFGELKPSSLSGFVYVDSNNDGIFENTEQPIASVFITLTGTDDLGQSVHQTASTDATGAYHFTNLRPGTYTIAETQPSAYDDGKDTIGTPGGTTANDIFSGILLPTGYDGQNNNFGELLKTTPTPLSSLSGFVYVDGNNNGVFDSSEQPIASVLVALSGTNDLGQGVNQTALTDATGAYHFTNLRPGTYTLTETQPTAYLDGKDTIGTPGGTTANDQFSNINLPAGFDGVNNNFGELRPSSLSGFVYLDGNNDGIFENTEQPIAQVTVSLSGTDDLGRSIQQSALTDATGAYHFTNLRPGVYTIHETQPAAYDDGKDTIGTPGGDTSNDTFSNVNLPSGYDGVNNNFGELQKPVQPTLSSLSGFVYVDQNNDGTFENGEKPIAAVKVALTGIDDQGSPVSLTTQTDSSGAYHFTNLRPGTYKVAETQPIGYLDGKDTIGTPGGTTTNDQFSNIHLPAGFAGVNNNFGELIPGEISGFVYVDANKDKVREPGETGITPVLVVLKGTDDLGNTVTLSALTTTNGAYDFPGLRPGSYTVSIPTAPKGYLDWFDSIGNSVIPGSDKTDVISGIAINPGDVKPNNNFGFVTPGTPGGGGNGGGPPTTVVNAVRHGIHHQPTQFILTFSGPLDPVTASNPGNYRLVRIAPNGQVGSQRIPFHAAVYDPVTRTVTLTPFNNLNVYQRYQLTVSGVKDLSGNLIDGNNDGQAGGNYVTTLSRANLVKSVKGPAVYTARVDSWAAKYPRLAAVRLHQIGRMRNG